MLRRFSLLRIDFQANKITVAKILTSFTQLGATHVSSAFLKNIFSLPPMEKRVKLSGNRFFDTVMGKTVFPERNDLYIYSLAYQAALKTSIAVLALYWIAFLTGNPIKLLFFIFDMPKTGFIRNLSSTYSYYWTLLQLIVFVPYYIVLFIKNVDLKEYKAPILKGALPANHPLLKKEQSYNGYLLNGVAIVAVIILISVRFSLLVQFFYEKLNFPESISAFFVFTIFLIIASVSTQTLIVACTAHLAIALVKKCSPNQLR